MTRLTRFTRADLRDDEGSTLPLIIFFGFLSLALILLVVAASSLYLERKRLFTVADGASLSGAEAFSLDDVQLTDGRPRPVLQTADVAAAVSEYLASAAPSSLESLSVDRAETVDGASATVSLSAYWRPPVLSILVPKGFRIEVTSVARSVFY